MITRITGDIGWRKEQALARAKPDADNRMSASNWWLYAPSLEAPGATKIKEHADSKSYFDFAMQNKKSWQGTGFCVNRP